MMTMRNSTMVFLLAVLLAATLGAAAPHPRTGTRPNVVLYVADDLGWADVGYHGSNFPTPEIDRLAASGVRLERFYTYPQCSPTRSALLTGRFAFRLGTQHFATIMPGATAGIPREAETLAETLRAASYATAAIGKWHVGAASQTQLPLGRGFDSYVGYANGMCDYYNRTLSAAASYPGDVREPSYGGLPGGVAYDFWRFDELDEASFGQYAVDEYDAEFERIIEDTAEPFFVYYAQQLVHVPVEAPPSAAPSCAGIAGGAARETLCSMVARLDDSVGAAVKALRPVWDRTAFLFVSDNGGMTDIGVNLGSASSNFPHRGGKTTLFEGGVRVPAFVAGGLVPETARGSRRDALLHAVDIAATIRSLAGVSSSSFSIESSSSTSRREQHQQHHQLDDGLDFWTRVVASNESQNATVLRDELPLNVDVEPLDMYGTPPGTNNRSAASPVNYSALIVWPYKLIVGTPLNPSMPNAVADGYWTIDEYVYIPPPRDDVNATPGVHLFDLATDPAERTNLADAHPEVVARLAHRLQSYWANPLTGFRRQQWNQPVPAGNPNLTNWTWRPFM